MAAAAGAAIFCELQSSKTSVIPSNSNNKFDKPTTTPSLPLRVKTVLQPRLCTLRSYASDSSEILIKSLPIRTRTRSRPRTVVNGGRNNDKVVEVVEGVNFGDDEVISSFFGSLSEYIENSKKSQDMEIISGRLAMVVFVATVTMEFVTGNSLFQKMDLQGIAEATGVCLAAIVSAAVFAWFSSNRTKVGRVFAISCNSFIDSLIDNLIDGLFFETELGDWSSDDK